MNFEEIEPMGYVNVKYVWPIKFYICPSVFYYSNQFKIDGLENVSFSMALKFYNKLATLGVIKSSSELAKATIRISIGDLNKKVDVNDWKDCCWVLQNYNNIQPVPGRQFSDSFHGNFFYYSFDITCEIIWKDVIIRKHHKHRLEDTLYNEMKKFCNSEELSDATIIVDNAKIPVHKLILAAHSPVFSAMLQSDMKEAKDGVINIEDLDSGIVLEMLNYCYKGETKASDDTEIALKVLEVADIYQIAKLKAICVTTLQKNISVDNALRIVDAADDHDSVELRETAIKFIVNHKKKVFMSNEFERLFREKQDLMLEIVRATVNT